MVLLKETFDQHLIIYKISQFQLILPKPLFSYNLCGVLCRYSDKTVPSVYKSFLVKYVSETQWKPYRTPCMGWSMHVGFAGRLTWPRYKRAPTTRRSWARKKPAGKRKKVIVGVWHSRYLNPAAGRLSPYCWTVSLWGEGAAQWDIRPA